MGCAPTVAKVNDIVSVEYTGELVDGTQFDSSVGKDPLVFQIGQGKVVPGFENAVLGMQVGETKTVEIPSDDAYGDFQEDLVFHLPTSEFPPDTEFALGATVVLRGDNVTVRGIITDFTDTTVTVDANHPLAGETLIFHLELLEIVEPA
ncbi:MAG: FKBP-type peptidyl-prolyl cis-trans isomerase [Dehalococcoidia bacterium]|nr:FKBP-type peptidyl-prolyl cis-trans isomerase [Dehalococcoidia bacterium]